MQKKAIITLLLTCLPGALISQVLIGSPSWGLSAALLANLLWHLHQLKKFAQWLQQKNQADPPQASGIWGDIFDKVYKLQRKTRKARKQLESHIQRAQNSANAVQDGVIIVNQSGHLEWWNNAATELLSFQKKVDRNRPITHLVRHPGFVHYFNTGAYDTPYELASPEDPKTQLQVEITRFGKDERLLLIRNITNIHKLEQMRTDFVANVSHELRTPLTVLIGYLEAFENTPTPLSPPLTRGVRHMRDQSKRMQALIDDLLLLSRLEQSSRDTCFTSVDVLALLESLAQEVEILSSDKKITTSINMPQAFALMGNEIDLHSAFINLLTNAIKYSPAESHIDIIGEQLPTGEARIIFQDHGIGIDPAFIPRLTERFYRVDASRATSSGGTGLGLAIVKHVLLHHQAQLIIESEPNVGSRFICEFPKSRTLTMPAAADSEKLSSG